MRIIAKITNDAALRSGENVQGNQYSFEFEPGDLPGNVRRWIADRLYDGEYLCVSVLDKDDNVEPSVSNGGPDLLVVHGTELKNLIQAVREDQEEVERCLGKAAAQTPAA